MTKLPALTGKELIYFLQKMGFYVVRQQGSHIILQHNDKRSTVIPIHSGESIGQGFLSKILRDIEMTKDEFIAFVNK
ncbi:MAG: type II toxin-antitoxin system HicA family toxin [Nitrospirae bacterium]|nr:type II toxin-antitoxin system HicA family toxin [Nitrospirota bacterium]